MHTVGSAESNTHACMPAQPRGVSHAAAKAFRCRLVYLDGLEVSAALCYFVYLCTDYMYLHNTSCYTLSAWVGVRSTCWTR